MVARTMIMVARTIIMVARTIIMVARTMIVTYDMKNFILFVPFCFFVQ